MAVNFKKLVLYSTQNKSEKIYNYLKINRHSEITKDDIDKIMDLDFDIKTKIGLIKEIKKNIWAVSINDAVIKYFMYRVTIELKKEELQFEEIMCLVNILKFFYNEDRYCLKTYDSNIDNLFIASMQLLQKEVNEQLPDYKELDEMIDVIYRIRIADLCSSFKIFKDAEALDKGIKRIQFIVPSPLLTITSLKYDDEFNYLFKRIIELNVDDVNARDKNGYTFLHNYLNNFGVQNPSNTSQLLEVAVKHGFNVNSEPTLLCNSLRLSVGDFLCVYDMLKEFNYDLINDKSTLFICDEYFLSSCENIGFYMIKDIYLKMVIKYLILNLEKDKLKINPNLGKKLCEFDEQLYDALEHLDIYYNESLIANELYEIIIKNRNESLCVVNEEVDAEEVLYALKELLTNLFNDVSTKIDDVLEVKSLVKKIDSK